MSQSWRTINGVPVAEGGPEGNPHGAKSAKSAKAHGAKSAKSAKAHGAKKNAKRGAKKKAHAEEPESAPDGT